MKKVFCMVAVVLAVCLVADAAFAAPSVKRSRNTFEIKEAVTDEILAQVAAEMAQVKQEELGFELRDIKDEDLVKLCAAYPNIINIVLRSNTVTSLTPLAGLKGLQKMDIGVRAVEDLMPLAALTEVRELKVQSDPGFGVLTTPDLKWMSGMTKLTKIDITVPYGKRYPLVSFEGIPSLPGLKRIDFMGAAADLTPLVQALPALEIVVLRSGIFHDLAPLVKLGKMKELSLIGSEVKDFSPLVENSNLRIIRIGSTKGADHSTLGKLTQVTEIHSGIVLEDISWVANLPNLKILSLFNEHVSDLSPITKIQLESFSIGLSQKPVDLTTLRGATSIKTLELSNIKEISGFEALGTLVNLESLKIVFLKERDPIDIAFLSNLTQLKTLNLEDSIVRNFDAVEGCAKLETVVLKKTQGVTSLAALKKLPALKTVEVTKGAFSDAELSGFAEGVKVRQ